MYKKIKVIIKGGGDLGSGIAHRLFVSGLKIITEKPNPVTIRRKVSFAEAVYSENITIEGVTGIKFDLNEAINDINSVWNKNFIPVITDPQFQSGTYLQPDVIVDATLKGISQKNIKINDAPVTIGVGPGFIAGKDVNYVVETQRGHTLGSVITQGEALPNTGIPGFQQGYTFERVLYSPCNGMLTYNNYDIGDEVNIEDTICYVDDIPVNAKISGVLRGLSSANLYVYEKQKIGDIDPRNNSEYAFTISDKARAIGGGVLEAILRGLNNYL